MLLQTFKVVKTALEQRSLSGIVEVLDVIRANFQAAGCVIWEENPSSDLSASDPRKSLFVLAQCFSPRRVQSSWNLDLNTPMGEAVVQDRIYECRDIHCVGSGNAETYPFKLDPSLTQFCAIPIKFPPDHTSPAPRVSRGALALYLRSGPFFTSQQTQHICETAQLFPSLHNVIRNHVSLPLIDFVTRTIQNAEADASMLLTTEQMNGVIQDICVRVAEAFGCMETSVYLEESTCAYGEFRLVASTLQRSDLRDSYPADPKEGLTGWLLHKRKPKWIFDLSDLKNIIAADAELADAVWHDPMKIEEFARRKLGLTEPEQVTPPMSWMGAPILAGNRVLGAIRCCVSRQGPFYFADRELRLLSVVAAHLGQFWNNWLTRQTMNEENRLWRRVVGQVATTNRQVLKLLDRPNPTITSIVECEVLNALGPVLENIQRWIPLEAAADQTVDSPAETMRYMLDGQFELYRGLAKTVQDRYNAQDTQRRTYLNLLHQLRSPVLAAHRRTRLALERSIGDSEVRNTLLRIKGLCAKALTVTMSVKVYADLALGQTISARTERLEAGKLRQLAIECADDIQAALDAERDLRFEVDKKSDVGRKGFDALSPRAVLGDVDLLRQVLTNILDNAGKYGRNGSVVRVSAGMTRAGDFHITVYNKPFFRPRDPEKWKEEGWRGEEAQDVTAEGSGIGLYIVDRVMAAHHGKLEIIPVNNEYMTEVKLVLPVAGN